MKTNYNELVYCFVYMCRTYRSRRWEKQYSCVCVYLFLERGGWKEETEEKNTTKRQMVFRKQTRRQISNRFVRRKEIRFVGDFS